MAKSTTKKTPAGGTNVTPETNLIPDAEHSDYVAGIITEEVHGHAALDAVPIPNGPIAVPPSLPGQVPIAIPGPVIPIPRFCAPVSGRYELKSNIVAAPNLPVGNPSILLTSVVVRVDVDRFFPQQRISIELTRQFPQARSHLIARVTSDVCLAYNRRRVEAQIYYRDGDASQLPGTTLVFEATRTIGLAYSNWTVTLKNGATVTRTFNLNFISIYFDAVEFEVDRVANAATPVTTHATGSHPNRPATLANETISLQSVYQRAGFNASMSPNTSVIPLAGAGANGKWSNSEMHNAMVTYWSRFANMPKWAMWVLYANQHDQGSSLGGIMFDDIGPNHRQGTAIFTNSFIQNAPAGEGANAAAWVNRMVFWTAVHEMGHAFNLAHSWQKALMIPNRPDLVPWVPLVNEPEARSFMNYPYNVAGGQATFFSNFEFRFSDSELQFMRHAPRRFVQMGNSNWFTNHGFEAPEEFGSSNNWTLELRPNRPSNSFAFMEPIKLELKLTNASGRQISVDHDMLSDGGHISVLVGRSGGHTRQWRPMMTTCHEPHEAVLNAGDSLYGSHLIGASTNGWLIDEPGFYKVQAAVEVGGEIIVSNVLRLYVGTPTTSVEDKLAPDYFTEDVGRVLAFDGAPELTSANDVLREVEAQMGSAPAAVHASVALSQPLMRDFKLLEAGKDGAPLAIGLQAADVTEGVKAQTDALLKAPDAAAETLGNIDYFDGINRLCDTLVDGGDKNAADKILKSSIAVMKNRSVLGSVIAAAQRKLDRMS